MALNPNEDTEWNDILRAKGILPPKEGPTEDELFEAHDQAVREAQEKHLSDKELDELDELEDDEDDEILRHYREKRIREIQAFTARAQFGELVQISEPDYKKQVTEVSRDVWVVVHLFRDGIPACKLVNAHLVQLAQKYPTVKFVKIISVECIHNYPDRNLPTLLVYGHGDMQHQLVGLAQWGGMATRVSDLEAYLQRCGALPDQPDPNYSKSKVGESDDEAIQSSYRTYHDSDSDYD
ncbi:Proteolipid protein 2 [Dispira simplex]|nr:Proteolipid protein 2 [Dispira simplex]